MNKSDLEKMQKCQEEYEKYLKESPLHSVIDEIAKDIRDRQDNVMAMEFTRTIAELLRENGIVVHCTENSCIRDVSDKKIEKVYGVVFDSVDCTEHDKKFTKKIEELEECIEKLDDELTKKAGEMRDTDDEVIYLKNELCRKNYSIKNYMTKVHELKDKISELESKLSDKENLLKIKNGLCGESELSGLTPIEVAEKLINTEAEYETNSIQRAFGAGEKEKYNIFSVSELRQIAEHLLVYCNHNLEKQED